MRNEYKITKKEMMSWAKEYHLVGKVNIVLFILWCVVGIIGLGEIILLSFVGGDWFDWYISILFLSLAVFKLFFSRFLAISQRYKLFSKTYGVSEWIRATEFTDDEIVLYDHNSVSKMKYENIKKIKVKNNLVMIFLNDNLAIRLYKDAFVEGSWDECKKMIDSKIK